MVAPSGLFVDANLLVLYVVGNVDEELDWQNTAAYANTLRNDYGALCYSTFLVRPNSYYPKYPY